MVVCVSLLGIQKKLANTERIQVPLANKMRVSDVFSYITSNYPELSLTEDMTLVTVNNNVSSLDQSLSHDDEISFIPHVGGG